MEIQRRKDAYIYSMQFVHLYIYIYVCMHEYHQLRNSLKIHAFIYMVYCMSMTFNDTAILGLSRCVWVWV